MTIRAKWEFKDGPLTGRRKKKAEDLPWKEFDIETQRDLDKAYEFRHEYPFYVYKYKFDADKELKYTIHLMHDDDKMFQTNDGTDVKRPVRRTPLAQVTYRNTTELSLARTSREQQRLGKPGAAVHRPPLLPLQRQNARTQARLRDRSGPSHGRIQNTKQDLKR